MLSRSHRLFVVVARIAGVAVALFLAIFALDAFDGRPFIEALPGFAIHLLPSAAVGGLVLIGARWPWMAATGFAGCAVWYATRVGRLDWIAAISGPLVVVAVLFALSALSMPKKTGGERPILSA